MRVLLWAERKKLARSKFLWAAAFAVAMTGAIVFAQGQFSYYGTRYADQPGWILTAAQSLATFYVLPAVVALLGSYLIRREEEEDTRKALLLIPVKEGRLTRAKLLTAWAFSAAVYLSLFVLALLMEGLLHFEKLEAGKVLWFFAMYFLDGAGVFLAVAWIIALVARLHRSCYLALVFAEVYAFAGLFIGMTSWGKVFYPVTAVFLVSGYYEGTAAQRLVSLLVLTLCGGAAFWLAMPGASTGLDKGTVGG